MQPPESSKFKILDPLGEGAMGIVYRAVHEASGRTVALKFLRQSLYDDELVSSRFARELEICRKLDHPNIVAILEIGEEHGRSYLAMELLEAETMEERLKAMGPRPVDEIVCIFSTGKISAGSTGFLCSAGRSGKCSRCRLCEGKAM